MGAYDIVGNFTGLSSAVSVIQFLQRWVAGFGLSRAFSIHYAMALGNLKRYLLFMQSHLAANSNLTLNPARASSQVELPRPDR
jgi:hypothetical protein